MQTPTSKAVLKRVHRALQQIDDIIFSETIGTDSIDNAVSEIGVIVKNAKKLCDDHGDTYPTY